MKGVRDTGLSNFDGFSVFGGESSIFKRGGEEVNDCKRKALFGLLGRLENVCYSLKDSR